MHPALGFALQVIGGTGVIADDWLSSVLTESSVGWIWGHSIRAYLSFSDIVWILRGLDHEASTTYE